MGEKDEAKKTMIKTILGAAREFRDITGKELKSFIIEKRREGTNFRKLDIEFYEENK